MSDKSPKKPPAGWREASLYRPAWCGFGIGRSAAFVYQRIASGEIPAVVVAGALRVRRDAWAAWLERNTAELSAAPATGVEAAR